MAAKESGKKLRTFKHPGQFFAVAADLSKEVPIYIDANLGDGIKGDDTAQRIHSLGFHTVFLATGYEPARFKHLKFLAGFIGKEPPETWSKR